MIFNIIRHLAVLLFIKLPLQVLGIPILAITLPFIPRDRETLPRFLRYFDNHELHLRPDGDDGLSGPSYERIKWKDPTGFLARFNWLALRNPINYFQYAVLGFTMPSDGHPRRVKGDRKVGTHSYNTRGYYYQELSNGAFEFYMVQPLFKNYHFRARIGWKIGGHYSVREEGEHVQWVFAVTPFKKID